MHDSAVTSLLSKIKMKAANKGISSALQLVMEIFSQGKVQLMYTPQQRAKIGNMLLRMVLREQ